MKCAKAIHAVHAALYSQFAPDCETNPGACILWSIGAP